MITKTEQVHTTLKERIHYTVVQMKNSMRSVSAVNPVTTKNTGDMHDR